MTDTDVLTADGFYHELCIAQRHSMTKCLSLIKNRDAAKDEEIERLKTENSDIDYMLKNNIDHKIEMVGEIESLKAQLLYVEQAKDGEINRLRRELQYIGDDCADASPPSYGAIVQAVKLALKSSGETL